jgi:predicted glycosyltransferase
MRIWIDITAPAHVLVFGPIIDRLKEAGHEVAVTSRDYAQTQQLLSQHQIPHLPIGKHGGASRARKLVALLGRSWRMRSFGRAHDFQLALAHGSNDLAIAAHSCGIRAVNAFDYEFATAQHNIGCRLAARVLVPEAIPPQRLRRYGVGPKKLVRYPGLKEEYYLYDFEPDSDVLDQLSIDRQRVVVVLRPPPDVSLYHRKSNRLFPQLLAYLGPSADVTCIVLPRTEAQRQYVRSLNYPSLIVPDQAVDAQSLIALADLVVSAGGTINREAVALGTPVYTVYGGRLGGVDEALIREGRLRPLTDPRALELMKKSDQSTSRVRRDPALLCELMLAGADDNSSAFV